MVRSDSNYTEFAGPTITIANELGAPLPHPEIESSYLYPPLSGAAIARVKNCSGLALEFDYVGDTGGCSADDLWIMSKPQDSPICTSVDVLLLPCNYRGTAVGMGEERGVTYEFEAVPGKAYIIEFAGNAKLFINETEGDERASTDTGHLVDLSNPDRFQNVAQVAVESAGQAEGAAAPAASGSEEAETQTVLPVSGQAATEANVSFIITGAALLVLMLAGGLVAVRRGKRTT